MKKAISLIIFASIAGLYFLGNRDQSQLSTTSINSELRKNTEEVVETVIEMKQLEQDEISLTESSTKKIEESLSHKSKEELLFENLETGENEKVIYLLDNGANIEAIDSYGNTPLLKSLDNGNLELAKILLDKGANPLVSNAEGLSVATAAALQFNTDLFKKLVEKGASANPEVLGKMNLLMNLSMEGHSDMVSFILEKKPQDINLQDEFGNTALHYAVKGAHLDVVKAIMAKKPELNIINSNGMTALDIAEKDDYSKIVDVLSSGN